MSPYRSYRAVILDRDGVINDNPDDYVLEWSEFIWLPGALDALRQLHECGVAVAIVTNQGCIARGLVTAARIDAIHARMMAEVEAAGGSIHGVYSCPHYHEGCECEKPAPGNVFRALGDMNLNPDDACFVGDRTVDMRAAAAAGMDGFMVRSGYQNDWPHAMQSTLPPVAIFDDLAEFVSEVIIEASVTV
jgi:D-glycero-D-manno-heptose 1,7-bisphosphate phosphatase